MTKVTVGGFFSSDALTTMKKVVLFRSLSGSILKSTLPHHLSVYPSNSSPLPLPSLVSPVHTISSGDVVFLNTNGPTDGITYRIRTTYVSHLFYPCPALILLPLIIPHPSFHSLSSNAEVETSTLSKSQPQRTSLMSTTCI